MKNILLLLSGAMCVSGCAATLTPNGDVYTELLAPTSTVIVEERPVYPVVVQAPRPPRPMVHRPHRPMAPAPRYAKYPGPRVSHKPSGPKVTPRNPQGPSTPKGKTGPTKPQGKPGPQGKSHSHSSPGPHGR